MESGRGETNEKFRKKKKVYSLRGKFSDKSVRSNGTGVFRDDGMEQIASREGGEGNVGNSGN